MELNVGSMAFNQRGSRASATIVAKMVTRQMHADSKRKHQSTLWTLVDPDHQKWSPKTKQAFALTA